MKKIRTVVLLAEGEQVLIVRKNAYYKLGYPLEDIIQSDRIIEAQPAYWCDIAQEWITT